jgi:alpha-glucosidase
VERQRTEPDSFLQLYRRTLACRRESPALRLGDQRLLNAPDGVLAWERTRDGDRRVVAIHFGGAKVALDLGRGLEVQVSSRGRGEGRAFDGRLLGDEAVILG